MVRLHRTLVPGLAELAAAADVRQDEDAAAFQPGPAVGAVELLVAAGVRGHERIAEPAVREDVRRPAAVQRHALRRHLEVGHPRAVGRDRPVLAHLEAAAVEGRCLLLHRLRNRVLVRHVVERRRRHEVLEGDERVAARAIHRFDLEAPVVRQGNLPPRPPRRRLLVPVETTPHVVQHGDEDPALRRHGPEHHFAARGFGQHVEAAAAGAFAACCAMPQDRRAGCCRARTSARRAASRPSARRSGVPRTRRRSRRSAAARAGAGCRQASSW